MIETLRFPKEILETVKRLATVEVMSSEDSVEMMRLLKSCGYQFLGAGSYRLAIHKPEENVVIKFPICKDGYRQNRREWYFSKNDTLSEQYKSMFARCLEHNNYYAVYEKADSISLSQVREEDKEVMFEMYEQVCHQEDRWTIYDLDPENTYSFTNYGMIEDRIVILDYPMM